MIKAVSDVIAGYWQLIGEEENGINSDLEHIAWMMIRIRQAGLTLRTTALREPVGRI